MAVADMLGYAANSSWIRGSTASTSEPAGLRWYFGGRRCSASMLVVVLALFLLAGVGLLLAR